MSKFIEVKTNRECFLTWAADTEEDFQKKKEEANKLIEKYDIIKSLISFDEGAWAVGIIIPNLTFNSDYDSDDIVLRFLSTQSESGTKIYLGANPISNEVYKAVYDLLNDDEGDIDFMGFYSVFDSKSGDTYACTIEGFDENGLVWDCELDQLNFTYIMFLEDALMILTDKALSDKEIENYEKY